MSISICRHNCKLSWESWHRDVLCDFLMLNFLCEAIQFSSVQSLSRVRLFATPWITVCQASLSITNSRSLLKPMSIELVMPSNRLILCRPLLLLPPIHPSVRVFSSESTLRMRWPKYWSFSFSISPSNDNQSILKEISPGCSLEGCEAIVFYNLGIIPHSISTIRVQAVNISHWHKLSPPFCSLYISSTFLGILLYLCLQSPPLPATGLC